MTGMIPRRPPAFPDVLHLLETGWPFGDRHLVRIEDYVEESQYVVRAELPGFDPDKDIQINVDGNELTIHAERTEDKRDKGHREFSYGAFARTVRLPRGADPGQITAQYNSGILEVTVPLKQPTETRQIPVAKND